MWIQKYFLSVVHATVILVEDFNLQWGIRSPAVFIGSPPNHVAEFLLPACRGGHIQCINTEDSGGKLSEPRSGVGSLGVHSLDELIG